MTEKKRIVLVPSYLEKFACIGSACEDTCCVGWRVDIDQKTYKKYKNVGNWEIKSHLSKHIKRNRSNPSEGNYAKIVMKSNNACPLLNEDKLCSIQKELGEDYLSNVCSTYPRVTNQVNEILEKSATLSCPEAARLALLNPEGIQFNEIEESIHSRNVISKKLNTNSKIAIQKMESYFWELRIFTIQVLQNRSYSLAHRVIILGMFYQKVQGYINDGNLSGIPQQIASYTILMEDGSFREGLSGISSSVAIQMQLLKELADVRVFHGIQSERYMECFGEVLHGIQYTKDSIVEEIAERYQKAYDEYYAPFMSEHEYILENYLVNYVYKNLFPRTSDENVFEAYILLVVHYSLIKLHLIGMAGHHKKAFGLDHIIKLTQSFAKTVEHNPLYLRDVIELLKKNSYTSMAYMAILINN
ncbi:flagellin lysine-N-methylase [Paenibacillus odorifer]|uniref:Lysine-N-methylase n=1 Tax=Paenibacillus odorifer TaxID=189426 RepID=A0A1R0Y278_9BACL|nr:flagellin lysine-N-methylase [Paenibacillus odorifer]OMD41435.1 lysine-N-methylase [Paenibacillus odorifer]